MSQFEIFTTCYPNRDIVALFEQEIRSYLQHLICQNKSNSYLKNN
ncbi:hypothetical protein J8281_05550 [Aquimarina sp. U1-2]|nr:hypothetical protein [Aquimarina sp. U1-2]